MFSKKSQEEKFRIAIKLRELEFVPICIITIDEGGNVIDSNLEVERLFGFTFEEMQGDNLLKIIPIEYRLKHLEGMKRIESDSEKVLNKSLFLKGLNKSGEIFPIKMRICKWMYEGKKYYTAYLKELNGTTEGSI